MSEHFYQFWQHREQMVRDLHLYVVETKKPEMLRLNIKFVLNHNDGNGLSNKNLKYAQWIGMPLIIWLSRDTATFTVSEIIDANLEDAVSECIQNVYRVIKGVHVQKLSLT